MIPVRLQGSYREDGRYALAMVNITNRCNLHCEHCFIYRDGNPNLAPRSVRQEFSDDAIVETMAFLKERHGIQFMLWMGGEPLLRKSLLTKGVPLFARNTITTNGTVPLVDLGESVLYVVSLDGPEDINDLIRGKGSYRRVMKTLSRIPPGFRSAVQVQCVVTRKNQDRLEELVKDLQTTRAGWMSFSFHVPAREDRTGNAWSNLGERMAAVEEVRRLKQAYPSFVRNKGLSLDLMSPDRALGVTSNCPSKALLLPLWLDLDGFRTPFCCYGNDVDCDRCGAWVVFQMAAVMTEMGQGMGGSVLGVWGTERQTVPTPIGGEHVRFHAG
ncbi:MAG: radical SAM protein [Nitrospirae bacterium]|nr:radical SAM protein [Nitrospirota bacterium]